MSDNVSHPSHYTQGRFGIECIEVIRREVCTLANVVKYVWRHAEKNGLEDLRKAEQYLDWAIEDHVMLTPTAVVKIRDHVEPVTREMTIPADDVYRVIVDLSYGHHFEARTRLRNAIASWDDNAHPAPWVPLEPGDPIGIGDTSVFSDAAHLPRAEARSHIAGTVDGCTATFRGSELVVEHALGCTADHEITATVPDDGVERLFVYGGDDGHERMPYRVVRRVAWQRGKHVEIVTDGPPPSERARDTIERVRKGIADALGDSGFES